MKKVWLILVMMLTALAGAEIHWEKNITTAIETSAKQNKPLMVLITKHGCKWCDVLKQKTLKDPKVIAELNKSFISYEGVVEEGTVPPSLMTPGTPATWFIKGRTPMFEPLMGAVDAENYLKALAIVQEEYKQEAPKK